MWYFFSSFFLQWGLRESILIVINVFITFMGTNERQHSSHGMNSTLHIQLRLTWKTTATTLSFFCLAYQFFRKQRTHTAHIFNAEKLLIVKLVRNWGGLWTHKKVLKKWDNERTAKLVCLTFNLTAQKASEKSSVEWPKKKVFEGSGPWVRYSTI